MTLIKTLKKIPIDLGQANLRKITKGKLIAMSYVKKTNSKKALDVGCREGFQSKWLQRKGYNVISIDIEKNYKGCVVVDVNKGLPFKDDSFDLIWCSEVIEHLNNPKKTINEFQRILKQNGKMIITTPNSYFWLMWPFYFLGFSPRRIQNKGHKHFFNYKKIRTLFPKAKIYGYFPYCLFKLKIKSLVGLLSPTFVIIERK